MEEPIKGLPLRQVTTHDSQPGCGGLGSPPPPVSMSTFLSGNSPCCLWGFGQPKAEISLKEGKGLEMAEKGAGSERWRGRWLLCILGLSLECPSLGKQEHVPDCRRPQTGQEAASRTPRGELHIYSRPGGPEEKELQILSPDPQLLTTFAGYLVSS